MKGPVRRAAPRSLISPPLLGALKRLCRFRALFAGANPKLRYANIGKGCAEMHAAMGLTKIFIHGLEGSSQGTKGRFFRKRFPDMIIEDFRGSFQERMDKLEDLLCGKSSLAVVGSSFGGLMGAAFAINHPTTVERLILLAPALTFEEFKPYLKTTSEVPVVIIHGRQDHVIPAELVYQIARQVFSDLAFDMVEDDHVLTKTFPILDWNSLLASARVPPGGARGCTAASS